MSKEELKLVSGQDVQPFLSHVIDIDKVTLPPEYVTSFEMLEERFNTFPDSFVGIVTNEKLIGYFNFFPVKKSTMDLLIKGEIKNDIYLGRNDIYERLPDEDFDVYIITLAILPEFQNGQIIKTLTKEFALKMKAWKEGHPTFKRIYASVVSDDGVRFLQRCGFEEVDENPNLYKTDVTNLIELYVKD